VLGYNPTDVNRKVWTGTLPTVDFCAAVKAVSNSASCTNISSGALQLLTAWTHPATTFALPAINQPGTAQNPNVISSTIPKFFQNRVFDAISCKGYIILKIGSFSTTEKNFLINPAYNTLLTNPACSAVEVPFGNLFEKVSCNQATCAQPLGLVSLNSLRSTTASSLLPDSNLPYVEYNADGRTYSIIKPENFPQGVRLFLKDGHVYAEYIGLYRGTTRGVVFDPPEVASPRIDFNATVNGTMQSSYTTLTVTDYISATQRYEKQFNIKIIGNETNCTSPDGIAGLSGAAGDTHLLYDWDYSSIQENQCDATNVNYTYCDGAQFLISTVKKLDKINSAIIQSDAQELAQYSSSYVYLIKDNYGQNMLKDFDTLYSTKFLDNYTPLRTRIGLDKLINAGRIKFAIRNGDVVTESGALPKGGIYFATIDVNYDNPENQAIITAGQPSATITITFSLYKDTSITNPLYEMPFDGQLGLSGAVATYTRNQYGAGTSLEIALNSKGVKALPSTTPAKSITTTLGAGLDALSSGVVLTFNSTGLNFTPSQPTPIAMSISASGVNISKGYKIEGYGNSTSVVKLWNKRTSTMGAGCNDFSGKIKQVYSEARSTNTRVLTWVNASNQGKMYFSTTFFTPKTDILGITELTPIDLNVQLFTVPGITGLTNGSAVQLRYYDVASDTPKDYDTLAGVLALVKKGDMCISKEPTAGQLKVWWNPSTLEKLEKKVPVSGDQGINCSGYQYS
ncbi:MAG: hypothetical protein WCI04_01105, partial [archaeon]